MPDYPVIKAKKREETGKHASRRLRREGLIPAVMYGSDTENQILTVDAGELEHIIEERERMVEVRVGRKKQPAMIKEVQFDHLGLHIQHVDFEGISLTEKLTLEVPIETHGTAVGVRNGGVLDVPYKHVRVECLPADMPNEITVEIGELEIGGTVTVADLPVPEGVEILDDPETVVVAIHQPRELEEEVEEEALEEQMAEPEVITARREEEEEEEGEFEEEPEEE